MFRTFRKHQSWLMIVIMGLTIVAFVVFFSPSARFSSRQGGAANLGSIDGQPISLEDYRKAETEARLGYFFRYGRWPGNNDATTTGFDLQSQTYYRLFPIQKLKDLDIKVDDLSVAQRAAIYIRNLLQGKTVPVSVFVEQVLGRDASAEDFERYLRNDIGIQQLVALGAMSAELMPPQETQFLYEYEHQERATEAVFFSVSNYLAKVPSPSPEAVAQFYTNQMAVYRLPERVQVNYVEFGVTNRFAQAEKQLTNLTELVEANFENMGTNYLAIADTPEAAKEKIREKLLQQQATIDAQREANDFLTEVYSNQAPQLSDFMGVAKAKGLPVKVTQPFGEDYGPDEFYGGPNFATVAFSLSTNDPIAGGPITGGQDVYAIAFDKRLPSEIPPLTKIHDKVVADYQHQQALLLARLAGQAFDASVTNGLAGGKNFSEIATNAGFHAVAVPPFSLSTQTLPEVEDQADLNTYKQIVFATQPGHASRFVPDQNGGLIVFVERVLPVDEAKMKSELPAFVQSVRQVREQEAINLWMQKGMNESLSGTPLQRESGSAASAAD